ncbi:hypothetical protein [[Mycoplasma] testudinis]|uniref:hypothetical protein n=1 Tax=[Mycoplasma] testudinis TaxID=33924 RepID=UPI0012EB1B3E|nr:hypothetical protein [[Mycoplasma] testudinis]
MNFILNSKKSKKINVNNLKNKTKDFGYRDGIVMYVMLFAGYLAFAVSWNGTLFIQNIHTTFNPENLNILVTSDNSIRPVIINGQTTGFNSGFIYQFFPHGVSLTVSRGTNWSITIGRTIGTFFFGWLITKINHKYTVLTAFGLIVLSFPYLLAPLAIHTDGNGIITNSSGVYVMFILFRVMFAFGGSAIISYANSVIATNCSKDATKFSTVSVLLINTSAATASIFLLSPIITLAVGLNWQIFGGVVQVLFLIIFCLYWLLGKKLNFHQKTINAEHEYAQKNLNHPSKNIIRQLFKYKQTIPFLIAATFIGYVSVEPSTNILLNFITFSPFNKTSDPNLSWTFGAFNIVFLGGIFLGIVTISKWAKTKYALHKFTGIMITVGSLFIASGIAIGYHGLDDLHISFMIILTFIGSAFIFGVRGNFYTMPYRWGFSKKEISVISFIMFGFTYGGYTILDIITSGIIDAGIGAIQPEYPRIINHGDGAGAIPAVIVMFLITLIPATALWFTKGELNTIKFSFKDFYQRYIVKTIK